MITGGNDMDYKRGLQALKECLAGADAELQSELATLENRFQENERAERIFGQSENTRNTRAQIIFALNELTLKYCGISFNDLCQGAQPTPSVEPRRPPVESGPPPSRPRREPACERASQAGIEPAQSTEPISPPDNYHYDAFISYSHHDKTWVCDTLLPRLERKGLRVCIDFRDFEPGAPSLTEMERAALQSRKTLLVLTPDYLASEWTEFENILASTLDPAARQRRVIPLLLKPCELPLRIRALTYLDFTKPDETEFQFRRLVAALQGTASATVLEESISSSLEEEKPLWAISAPNVHKSLSYPKEHPIVDNSKGMRSRYVHIVKNVSAEVAAAAFDAFGRDLAPGTGIRFKRKRDIPALVEYTILTVDIDQRSNLILGESDRGTVRFQTLPSDTLEVSIEVLPTFPRGWRIPFVTDEMVLNFFNSFVDQLRGLEPSPLVAADSGGPAQPPTIVQPTHVDSPPASEELFPVDEEQALLLQELAQHKRNLYKLREKKAKYGIDVPLSVVNQIEDEEREIARIQAELESLGENSSGAHPPAT
jgi:hypothetical protein